MVEEIRDVIYFRDDYVYVCTIGIMWIRSMLSEIKFKMMFVQCVAMIYTLGLMFEKWQVYNCISCAQTCLDSDVHKWCKIFDLSANL